MNVRFVCRLNWRVACSGMPPRSTWPSSMTSPVRISFTALSTDVGFMWLPDPRSSPAPHFDGQRWLSGGGIQDCCAWAVTHVSAKRTVALIPLAVVFMCFLPRRYRTAHGTRLQHPRSPQKRQVTAAVPPKHGPGEPAKRKRFRKLVRFALWDALKILRPRVRSSYVTRDRLSARVTAGSDPVAARRARGKRTLARMGGVHWARSRQEEAMKTCLRLLGTAIAAAAIAGPAAAQFPTRPVKIVVGFPPGSTPDLVTRTVAERLRPDLGQPVVVENRPGAGSTIATEAVARSPAIP